MKKNGKPCLMAGSKSMLMVIRDHLDTVLLSAWRAIFGPSSAEEVEARACMQGGCLSVNWEKKKRP
jgi:hypothetical protein